MQFRKNVWLFFKKKPKLTLTLLPNLYESSAIKNKWACEMAEGLQGGLQVPGMASAASIPFC